MTQFPEGGPPAGPAPPPAPPYAYPPPAFPPPPAYPPPPYPPPPYQTPHYPTPPYPPATWGPPPGVATNGQPLAGPADRFLARLIDGLIMTAVDLIVAGSAIAGGIVLGYTMGEPGTNDSGPSPGFVLPIVGGIVLAFVLLGVLSYLYYVGYFHRHGGQTIGKRSRQIRVVRVDGHPITISEARRRWLANEGVSLVGILPVISSLASMYSLADALWLLWDKPNQQCLHDKYAVTVVVKAAA